MAATIPDPDIARAPHVAVPLADLAPDWIHPQSGLTLRQIASRDPAPPEGASAHHGRTAKSLATSDTHFATDIDATVDEVYDPQFESLIRQMLVRLGEDPDREGLKKTPLRVAKAMDFLTSGYRTRLEDVVHEALFETCCEEMVIVKDIEFYSMCEHHMLPFFGRASVGYIPNGKILGLSKVARLVDMYARRLQVQERLTNQIADAMMEMLNPLGVGVVIEAQPLLHDDARGREAEQLHDDQRHARQLPRRRAGPGRSSWRCYERDLTFSVSGGFIVRHRRCPAASLRATIARSRPGSVRWRALRKM